MKIKSIEKIPNKTIGIYKITNKINNKCYIGQSVDVKKRFYEHIKAYNYNNSYFYNAINKYGINNFEFEIIEECSKDILSEREIYWIDYYNSTDRQCGYNIAPGGYGGFLLEGYTQEERQEVYNKISKARKGRTRGPNSVETNDKISKARKEYLKNNPDIKQKMINNLIDSTKNRTISDEYRQKMSNMFSGEGNPCYGKKLYHLGDKQKFVSPEEFEYYENLGWVRGLTDKRKLEISKQQKCRPHKKGYKLTEEHKKKLSKSKIGNTNSKGKCLGKIWVHKDSIIKMIFPNELDTYINNGWIKGRGHIKKSSNGRQGKIKITNKDNTISKFIYPKDFDDYKKEGWTKVRKY